VSAVVVARPRRLTKVCWLVAALVVVVFGVLSVALGRGPEGAAQFRLADQIAFFVLGLLVAGLALLFTRARVEATADGVHVRNPFGTKDVPWQVVREVRLDDGAPWAVLELHDDETVQMLAVQSNDGDAAVDVVLELRALLDASRGG
jgi:Bacterial PH domain